MSCKKHNDVLGGGGFHHIAIKVSDFDRSLKLYTEVLGFREKIRWGEGDGRGIMLDTGDGNYLEMFAGGQRFEPRTEMYAAGPIIHMAFRTTKLKEVTEKARAAGFKVTVEPKHVDIPSKPNVTPIDISFIHGPDGEVIELFQNDLT